VHERKAWWILNLAPHGVVGVLMSLLVLMGWGFGRISRWLGMFPSHTRFEVGDGTNIRF
jgi:hypothetical protein